MTMLTKERHAFSFHAYIWVGQGRSKSKSNGEKYVTSNDSNGFPLFVLQLFSQFSLKDILESLTPELAMKSQALALELLLQERLAKYGAMLPNLEITNTCFEILDELAQKQAGFTKIIQSVSSYLRRAVYTATITTDEMGKVSHIPHFSEIEQISIERFATLSSDTLICGFQYLHLETKLLLERKRRWKRVVQLFRDWKRI